MINPVNISIRNFLIRKKLIDLNQINNEASVITSTNQYDSLNNILNNFNRQDLDKKELIIVINNNKINKREWEKEASKYKNVRVFKLDQNISLGRCLNFGVDKAKYEIIAKFDDDDYYGPKYLSDSLKSFNNTDASLIGKEATFVYFVGPKILTIRNPHTENRYTSFVNGSTLIFKKNIFRRVQFQDKNIAEDINFCKDCIRRGIKIYSTNRFHHVYFRYPSTDKHTWKIEDDKILKLCCRLDKLNISIENIEDIKSYVDI